jgi:periplasmic protein TonB
MKFFITILLFFSYALISAQPAQTKTKPTDVATGTDGTKKELAFAKRKSAFDVPKKAEEKVEEKIDPNKIWENPDAQIEYITGNSDFIKFVQKELNVNVPINNEAPPEFYVVKIKIQVSKEGKIELYTPISNLGFGMEDEAIRLLKKTDKKWKPAMVKGKPVISTKVFSIVFNIKE